MKKYGRFIVFFITLHLFFAPVSAAIITPNSSLFDPPKDGTEGVKTIGERVIQAFSRAFDSVWRDALNIGQDIAERIVNLWNLEVKPWLDNSLEKNFFFIRKEFEKTKPVLEKEIGEEQKEMQQSINTEVPSAGRNLWERFRELIK